MKFSLPALAVTLILSGQAAVAGDVTLWTLALVDGGMVEYEATLDLSQAGRITGQAPCNSYFADITVEGEALTLGPIGATRMACDQMAAEAEYFDTLSQMDTLIQHEATLVLRGGEREMAFVPQKD